MPFITEEIWQLIQKREEGASIMLSAWPDVAEVNETLLADFEDLKEAVAGIRTIRKEKNIANKESLELSVFAGDKGYHTSLNPVLVKIANLSSLEEVKEEVSGALTFLVKSSQFFLPLGDLVNVEEELEKLEAELKYTKGFLNTVMKKLGNEKFVSGAPEKVVELERKKQADAEEKIRVISERIASLK